MTISERKNKIIEKLKKVNDHYVLERLENLLNKEMEEENNIVAYTAEGNPLIKDEYIQKVKEADEAVDKGEYTSMEKVKKESKDW